MKSIIFLLLVSFGMQTHAHNTIVQPSDINPVLTARKQSVVNYFRLGMPVRLVVKDIRNKKTIVKGYITHLGDNKITIGSFKKNDKAVTTVISPDVIEKIKPLSRWGRKTAAIVLGAGAVYAGVMGLISEPSSMQFVLFIPAFGIALVFFYYYPVTFLFDLIREKSKKNGWFFSIEMRR